MHLILLDLNLPDGSGYSFCQWAKKITGCSHYLSYHLSVLEARIHAVLRRTANPQDSRHSLLICGDIQMDCEKFFRLIITSVSDIAVTVQQKMRTIAESSFDPQPKPCYT